jgi:putative ABC transport system substrate-binding protein
MQFNQLKRREVIKLLGGAAAWPLAASAQHRAMPVVGFLSSGSSSAYAHFVSAFHKGLKETGYVEGQNVAIKYRWAEGQYDRMPALAADLVRDGVTMIFATSPFSALAAKAEAPKTPIVFVVPGDPVKLGLVVSLNRPGGNATGVNYFLSELGSKQLGLLHELVPAAARVGLLINPIALPVTEDVTKDVMAAASALGLQIDTVEARDSREIEAAFGELVRNRAEALLVGPDVVFFSRRVQLTTLAARYAIPAVYNVREYPEVGGLMSYGTRQSEAYRQAGVYAGQILKGVRPSDLPVIQSTKFELVINLPTARAIGLEVPPTLLARADEVIE